MKSKPDDSYLGRFTARLTDFFRCLLSVSRKIKSNFIEGEEEEEEEQKQN